MDLNLQGQSVNRVCFDAAFILLTSGDCELRVETEAVIKTPTGEVVSFDPEYPGAAAMNLAGMMRDIVSQAEVGKTGKLLVIFESGTELTVAPHADYEAWGLVGPNGYRVICMPGGEVGLWSEQGSA